MNSFQTRLRKTSFWIIVISLYLIIATGLIAGTNGYLFDWPRLQFVQTGLINLSLKQMPVTVTINGKSKIYKKSPIALSYLKPGSYTVEVRKDGFYTWTKSFRIEPGFVVVNPNVTLLRSDVSPILANASHRDELAAFIPPTLSDLDVRGSELWAKQISRTYPFTALTDNFALVSRFVSPIGNVDWTPNKAQIIFQVDNQIRIVDRDGSNDYVLAELTTSEPTELMMSRDDKTLIYRNGENVYSRQLF